MASHRLPYVKKAGATGRQKRFGHLLADQAPVGHDADAPDRKAALQPARDGGRGGPCGGPCFCPAGRCPRRPGLRSRSRRCRSRPAQAGEQVVAAGKELPFGPVLGAAGAKGCGPLARRSGAARPASPWPGIADAAKAARALRSGSPAPASRPPGPGSNRRCSTVRKAALPRPD